jgi:ParB family chromosome partitioning protein
VAVGQIEPNPWQPREPVNEAGLRALADSIRRHGVLQPLLVTRDPARPGVYILVAGERRWRAAQLAGRDTVPVSVVEADDRGRLEMALVENLQRTDLAPLERAAGYQALMEGFGLTQAAVGEALGVSRSAVANTLRLLEADEEVREHLTAGRLSEGHARALLAAAAGPTRQKLLREVLAETLSVRATERRVRASGTSASRPADGRVEDPAALQLGALAERLQRHLGTRVTIRGSPDKGRVVIEYFSDEELNALLERLLGGQCFT